MLLRWKIFETAIIERYKRCETSVEEAFTEMSLAGVSVRRVEDITAALMSLLRYIASVWGTRVSPSTAAPYQFCQSRFLAVIDAGRMGQLWHS